MALDDLPRLTDDLLRVANELLWLKTRFTGQKARLRWRLSDKLVA
jgi:hypothetical protein